MSTMTLKSLVDKLAPNCKSLLESSAALCNSRSHFSVEIQHWLAVMVDEPNGDLSLIADQFGIEMAELKNELHQALEQFKTGNSNTPGLSPHLVALLRSAWLAATIEFDDHQIQSVHLVYALLKDETMGTLVVRGAGQLERIDPSELLFAWPTISEQGSPEQTATPGTVNSTQGNGTVNHQTLAQYTIDLTEQAKAGGIDPILGRDSEIRQMIDILTRRRQNNPILTGEAGVGKTAVVEGLAQRIVLGDVPESLINVSIRVLDLALLQAGAGVKGEFENRLKSIIKEVKQSPTPIILFIDEAHTLIGSGGQAGQNDAANLIKPALARGELRTIAATTWAEYKKYFEKDAALTRRFQVVKVEEPDEATAVVMLRGLLPVMEAHHNVTITDKALHAAVTLSNRYINGRQLPDKAVALLDTACARVAMSQVGTPGKVEDLDRQRQQLSDEMAVLAKEEITGDDHSARLESLRNRLVQVESQYNEMENQWRDESNLVQQAKAMSTKLVSASEAESLDLEKARLKEIKSVLGENSEPMVFLQVDEVLVAEVISDWTGIPLGRMQSDEIKTILSLNDRMKERVIGQDHALDLMGKVVQTARAQLSDERKPDGVFLLTGPSGVGKTESALALAEQVYGSEDNVTIINMSEFKEEHKVSLLVGSPPGYVGFGEGGILTEAVRRKPYSVVLLDEMEKAHPGVQDIFYQVFDKGTLKDGEGRDIDFKNTIIIMTSNIGTETTMALYEDEGTAPGPEGLKTAIYDEMMETFKPAFLGRVNIVPYVPLSTEVLEKIVHLQLERIGKRLNNNYSASFKYTVDVVNYLINRCYDPGFGARAILNNLQNILLPLISKITLERLSIKESINNIIVDIRDDTYDVKID
ncbi:ClpV1 family T6SS ATPase [Photobacterium proteolyticum]|uniref:ClpV1 family T6SS ATPase n=1 Tax=Photobacterium proteolyticum TaxID=1903952 RepID=A0A1Q9G6Q3_9GAMM|nr:type VI secretion system ATPase TssH [Photobacterium proteolyticum]OLQ69961.1 ClpV1 family T6SS ATPase [Photobacterium proteolyticum]